MLNELLKYYEYASQQPDCGFEPDGYSRVTNVSKNLVLTADGKIKGILPYTHTVRRGKKDKEVGFDEVFPFRESSPGIKAETIDCREKYLFGMEWDKTNEKFTVSKSSLSAFEKNKEKNLEFLSDLSSPVIDAYKRFLNTWQPSCETENEILVSIGKSFNEAKFIITVEGHEDKDSALHNDKSVKEKWDNIRRNTQSAASETMGNCSISGKIAPIAKIHNNLKGIKGGLATGVNLVCYNDSAFCSYGKEQSYNSSVSVEAMEKYTKTFNFLASSNDHKRVLGDITLLFWVNTKESEKPYTDMFWELIEETSQNVSSVVGQAERGIAADWRETIQAQTTFCILGVKPNSSRLAIKFFEKDNFGNLMTNIERHQNDLRISDNDRQLSVFGMLKNLKSAKVKDDFLPSDLSVKLLQSVIKGEQYPVYLLETAVRRVKADSEERKKKSFITENRIRIIKAYLVRSGYYKKGDEYMLETKDHTAAYTCGRLFAVLEKLQKAALGELNAAIGDKYFSSACTRPDVIFPRLITLSRAHLAKLDKGEAVYYDKWLQEIIGLLENGEFPASLTLKQQGDFQIGYFQQKQKLYEKNQKTGDKQ